MNLTYFDDDFNDARATQDTPHRRTQEAMVVAKANKIAQPLIAKGAVSGEQLSGFFSSVVDSLKTTISAPLKATQALVQGGPSAALAQTKADFESGARAFAGMASVAAPVAAFFGPIGKIVAGAFTLVKATVAKRDADASADYAQKQAAADALKAASGNDAQLMDAYKTLAGYVPGRLYTSPVLKQIFLAGLRTGLVPLPSGFPVYDGITEDFWESRDGRAATNGSHSAPPGMRQIAEKYMNQGVADASKIAMAYLQETRPTDVPTSDLGKQIYIDSFDSIIADKDSNAPYTYGIDMSVQKNVQPVATTNAPAPGAITNDSMSRVPSGIVTTVKPILQASPILPGAPPIVETRARVPTPAAPKPAATTPAVVSAGVDPATAAMLNKLMEQMASQNASAAQMQQAAMQALAQAGVNTQSQAVQRAVTTDVATAQAPSGISNNTLLIGGAVAVGALLLLLNKRGK